MPPTEHVDSWRAPRHSSVLINSSLFSQAKSVTKLHGSALSAGVPQTRPQNALYADALRWNRGDIPRGSCPTTAQVSDFTLCWPPIADAIVAGTCTVYAIGVAKFDDFMETMASVGCHVFAFDPAANHPLHPRPNVTFHHWGLLTGAENATAEREFSGYYGSTNKGIYMPLRRLMQRLGHDDGRSITVMKMDCEGCEWQVFAEMHRSGGARALAPFGQIVTELHFSRSLRFDTHKARTLAPLWNNLVLSNQLQVFSTSVNEGYDGDREIDADLVAAGLADGLCCRELSLISADVLTAARSRPSRAGDIPPPQCDRKCCIARRLVARRGHGPPPQWAVHYLKTHQKRRE